MKFPSFFTISTQQPGAIQTGVGLGFVLQE
jgi:hypothetical protein